MKPTTYCYIGNQIYYPNQLENVDIIYPDEFFIRVINYDFSISQYYLVSNYGRLYSLNKHGLLVPYMDKKGYYRINICIYPGKHIFTGVHKITLMSFCPIKEADFYVPNHKDGNKQNNYIGNLEWMTVSENTRHALDTGLANYKCENNARSKMTNDTVHRICSMLEKDYSITRILNELNYDFGDERNRMGAVIRNIRKGDTYVDISKNYNIPGIKGMRRYEPEMTEKVCKLLTDDKIYRIDEICDILNIDLENRKMFKNYVGDILRDKVHSYITRKYKNKKTPLNVDKSDVYYDYYN